MEGSATAGVAWIGAGSWGGASTALLLPSFFLMLKTRLTVSKSLDFGRSVVFELPAVVDGAAAAGLVDDGVDGSPVIVTDLSG